MICRETAYGKLNLTLDVLGLREDGYHEMLMLMQTVSLCDTVTISDEEGTGWKCSCNLENVPADGDNLALKAAEVFFASFGIRPENFSVRIEKKIPMQGGMAGGSANAAAVLRGLNRMYGTGYSLETLMSLGEAVGSDVPYCVCGGTALVKGRGEKVIPLPPMEKAWFVLVKPTFSVSTPQLFRELDRNPVGKRPETELALQHLQNKDLPAFCGQMYNVFQPLIEKEYPVVSELCDLLRSLGAENAVMTGTGSVVYGVFLQEETAQAACKKLQERGFTAYLAQNV